MNFTLKLRNEEELKVAIEKATAKYEKLCDKSEKASAAFEKAWVRVMNIDDDLAHIRHKLNLLQEEYKRTKKERKQRLQKLKKDILNSLRICKDEKCSDDITKLLLCITYDMSEQQALSFIQKYGH
ncbi:MAG: hypothetical protein J6X49_16660 [Victivallales bacterium]|nr:hypothetical protein [Victivallales bacterium]